MGKAVSPLRYPGGKGKISPLVKLIINKMNVDCPVYIEPFAGGAGVAVGLLVNGVVSKIVINDYDKAIYSFWRAVKTETNALVKLIENTPITIDEWRKQKEFYLKNNHSYSLELGFAAFYLNRTNRSGILSAGPIGGYDQSGNYLINARFNKTALIDRILEIAKFKKSIFVYNKEVRTFITQVIPKHQENALVYFDPPYYNKGKELYKNFFETKDHSAIANCIIDNVKCNWIITYDDVETIHALYESYTMRKFNLNYSLANKGKGHEIIIFKSNELLPSSDETKTLNGNIILRE